MSIRLSVIAFFLVVIVTLAQFIGKQGPDELDIQQAEYCEMVALFKESKGELGWPDFKSTYDSHCIKSH